MPNDKGVSDFTRAIHKVIRGGKRTGVLKPYLNKARSIALCIHPFVNIQRVFYAGVPDAVGDEDGDEDGDEEYSDKELAVFHAIMRLERGFDKVVDACTSDTDIFLSLIKLISDAAGNGRSDDTNKIKSSILEYVYEDPKMGSRFPTDQQNGRLLVSDSKNLRGFHNIDTTDLLCPLRLRKEFENNPSDFMNKVADKKIEITSHDLPSFLYETGTVYNPENEAIGLFRGFLPVRVYRHIFTGPTSAMDLNKTGGTKNKARLFKISAVTGRTIAYACVQTLLPSRL